MDKFKTVVNIANKQTNLGFGVVALLTVGGEQIFSSVVFRCPCNELNFLYGMVFLLVPALALLLLGYILNKKTWKLSTGLCQHRAKLCRWRRLCATGMVFAQISTTALVAPTSWIAVALLNGNYYECAMTGTNILGWLLIASIMLSNLLLTCVARCTSPISYLQLKFWRAYTHEESNMIDSYTTKHAKDLAERNLKCFFNRTPPEKIITPPNKDWEKISSLYKFNTKEQYYSTIHRYVETCQETDNGMMRMASVKSSEPADDNPAVLSFVDDGSVAL
ncbi:calcium homeostasis modulator protein 6 isoform X2 [Chaetodon auriga]|uniref:calcium homeostasis modulator protein 6 isoform X2 n=1 Tax=Chaetodon auriga TaxID=39042 RepID=UPI0040330C19